MGDIFHSDNERIRELIRRYSGRTSAEEAEALGAPRMNTNTIGPSGAEGDPGPSVALAFNELTDVELSGTVNGSLVRANTTSEEWEATQNLLFDGTELTVSGHIDVSDYVDFGGIPDPAHSEGRLWYSTDTETLSFYNDRADVTLNIGEETWVRCRNTTGSQIDNGDVVHINGYDTGSGRPLITLSQADAANTAQVVGVATEDIPNDSNGMVVTYGILRGVDTSSFSAGDVLWLSPSTPGGLTDTEPSAPDFGVKVGEVMRSDATSGQILITPQDRREAIYTPGIVPFAGSNGALTEDSGFTFSAASGNSQLEIANTAAATIRLNQDSGTAIAAISAQSGSVRMRSIAAPFTIESGGGDLDVTAASGDITLQPNGQLEVQSANGLLVSPGSDTDSDLIKVNVTDTPTIGWDESADAFTLSKGISLDGGSTVIDSSELNVLDGGVSFGELANTAASVDSPDTGALPHWNGSNWQDTAWALLSNIGSKFTLGGSFTSMPNSTIMQIKGSDNVEEEMLSMEPGSAIDGTHVRWSLVKDSNNQDFFLQSNGTAKRTWVHFDHVNTEIDIGEDLNLFGGYIVNYGGGSLTDGDVLVYDSGEGRLEAGRGRYNSDLLEQITSAEGTSASSGINIQDQGWATSATAGNPPTVSQREYSWRFADTGGGGGTGAIFTTAEDVAHYDDATLYIRVKYSGTAPLDFRLWGGDLASSSNRSTSKSITTSMDTYSWDIDTSGLAVDDPIALGFNVTVDRNGSTDIFIEGFWVEDAHN